VITPNGKNQSIKALTALLYAVSFLSAKIKMRPRKLNRKTLCAFYALVPLTGLEPVRYCYRGILSF